jgi:GT2 family glycosyltransferase/tetratricopeptide (TPR) repeat protein/SAM-dependent methyltransferase
VRATRDDGRELVVRRAQSVASPNGVGSRKDGTAGTATEPLRLPIGKCDHAFDAVDAGPPFWRRVAVSGHRILVIGHDVAAAASDIKTRQPAALSIVEMDEVAMKMLDPELNEVYRAHDEGNGVELADGSFDAVIALDVFEKTRHPERILRKLRRWLVPGGRLITTFATVRSLSVVEGLLAGRWRAGAGKPEADRPIRFVTRREVEKALYRSGFATELVEALPGPGHAEWVERGRPALVKVDRLNIAGLPPNEVEEFYSRGFLLEAIPARIADFSLTSIIIVTFNQIDYTRQCVESIHWLTDEAYELIFVDNGSSDGTVEYLDSLNGVKVIKNAGNRGFPTAVNQGIAIAAGDQILLLNNDTIVTTGWLRRLLVALHSDPSIGLVGPCSNFVGSEQQIEVGYDSLTGLDAFAWEWGKANDGALAESQRLIGFCLLVRRALVESIGLLDERFGVGCFEDDDYCLRAIQAGWRAVIAGDTFVHHFGGRTFMGEGFDFAGIMRANEEQFCAKWGSNRAATGSRELQVSPSPERLRSLGLELARDGGLLLRSDRIRLSLCMIVRDSAATLRPCLESIRPWVDEMVIVDTGSTDETPRIVEELGGRLFHFPWCDDFSAARNESLRHARGDWLFWMDSDDTIPAECGRQLRALIDGDVDLSVLGYVVQVHCPGGGEDGDPSTDVTAVDHVKLIRNRPDLRFEGRIHEQILPAIRRAGGSVAWTELYVVHSGSDPSPEAQERKRRRDLRLLHLELREQPDHPFTLFNLGMTYADGERFEEAEQFLERSIGKSAPEESHLRKAYALLVYAVMRQGRNEEALSVCRRGLALFPLDVELLFREGVILHELRRFDEAVRAYNKLLSQNEERHFSSIDRGLTGFKARQNLAIVYTEMGDLTRAEHEWHQVTIEVPQYRAGWRGLCDVLIRGGRRGEAVALAERCLADPALRVEGRLAKSRLAMAAGDFASALAEVEQAATECPTDRAALEARCQILFDLGPPSRAEAALRSLIESHSNDASAHHNLGTLLLRLKRYDEAASSFRQALRQRSDAPATYLHLGYALKESGRADEAVAAWQQVLRLAPDDAAAREELMRARQRPEPLSVQRVFGG